MKKKELKFNLPVPKVGDDIYVPTSLYLSHGRDDKVGGLATVIEVKKGKSGGKDTYYVTVKEYPNKSYNWKYLAERQEELKRKFGNNCTYPNPDHDPQFNRW